jgi:tetratricopeptide (TPR) repeat protein
MGTSVPPGAWVELALSYLDRSEDAERAAAACDTALEIDASSIEALRLRADLDARLDDRAAEAARRETLANEILDPIESAAELARAAALRRDPLDQPEQASRLFRSALEREPGCLAALLGAGELAFERGRMDEAEPWLESAYRLLPGTDLAGRCAEIASLAARAAADLGLDEKALAHLEVALGESCEDPATVDLGATVALRLSAWQKARELLERRLSLPGLDDSGRADRLVRLARARESLDDRGAAADALEEAVRLRPSDEALRARLVDLLDELDEHRRLIEQLDGWAQSTGSDDAVALATRAARLELQHGDRARARERLDEIVLRYPGCADAWEEMAALQLDDGAPEEALARLTEGLEHVSDPSACAPLLGLKARALDALGQTAEAADAALAAVEANPKDAFAASYLAANVGRTGDWRRAAWALEHALDVARFPAPVQAEIWDAVGRVHAGPLQDLERAERAYRRALERNPDLDRAREALADVTSFDPAGHAESVALHLALLEKFPARGASWKALCRIAEHWKREEAIAACSWVLASLSRGESGPARAPALLAGLFPAPEVEVAAGLVRALEEAGHPMPQRPEDEASIPQPLTDAIEELAGALWRVPDEELGAVLENAVRLQDSADRRLRRRVREALRQSPPEAICALDPETCRSEILSTAVGRVAGRRGLEPRETFEALLGAWPATRELDLEVSGNIAEASQLCRPARTLLLRVAEGVKTRLGLG